MKATCGPCGASGDRAIAFERDEAGREGERYRDQEARRRGTWKTRGPHDQTSKSGDEDQGGEIRLPESDLAKAPPAPVQVRGRGWTARPEDDEDCYAVRVRVRDTGEGGGCGSHRRPRIVDVRRAV